jgi:hypothetical protein
MEIENPRPSTSASAEKPKRAPFMKRMSFTSKKPKANVIEEFSVHLADRLTTVMPGQRFEGIPPLVFTSKKSLMFL